MVANALEKVYGEMKHKESREILARISDFAKKYYEKFGKDPVVCWVNDDGYADLLLRRNVARSVDCGIVVMRSTEDALEATAVCNVALYVSNMGRPGDYVAGITLLKKLREMGNDKPYVVYTSLINQGLHGQEVLEAGGQACECYEEYFLAAVYAAMKHAYGEQEEQS